MLNKTLEFLRIADLQPNDEKVRKRQDSAKDLADLLSKAENLDLLLSCVQGAIRGFDSQIFNQESPAVVEVYKCINERDKTLPSDLKENAVELRAVASIALGELLVRHLASQTIPSNDAVLTAAAFDASLGSRPAATEKQVRLTLEEIRGAAQKVLNAAAKARREPRTGALRELENLEKPTEENDLWDEIVPTLKAVAEEIKEQDEITREEVETLWWLFAAYSELENTPLKELKPFGAALSSGIELAERTLLPPLSSAAGMVKRATEGDRQPQDMVPIKLQEAVSSWSKAMSNNFSSKSRTVESLVSSYPVLFPLATTCSYLREHGTGQKALKEVKALTGIPTAHEQIPSGWGRQIFREKVLQRMLAEGEEE